MTHFVQVGQTVGRTVGQTEGRTFDGRKKTRATLVCETDHQLKLKSDNINQGNSGNSDKLGQVLLSQNRLESSLCCGDSFCKQTPKSKQAITSFNAKFKAI